jgi:hypothetical protein
LEGAFFTKNGPKNHWQHGMVAPKETEVMARFWEVPEQLKKLKYQVQWKFPGCLGKLQRDNPSHRTNHFQVTFNKGGSYWKQIQNHESAGC